MRARAPMAAFAAAAALALTLTSCSSLPGGDKDLNYEDSPLNEYLSVLWGGDLSPEEQEAQFDDQMKREQEIIAQCMADEGFEYIPDTGGASFWAADDEDVPEWEPDKKEWVEKYGYGAVNDPWNEYYEQNPDAGMEEAHADPNEAYVETLSESEQNAYYETLWGPGLSDEEIAALDEDDDSFDWDWTKNGCYGFAQNEVNSTMALWEDERFSDLMSAMDELWETTQNAPEMADLNREWSSCMSDAGEPGFTEQSDAAGSIYDAVNAVYDEFYADIDWENVEEDFDPGDPADSPEMVELGEREIELALIDLDCRKKTNYTQKSLEIQFALEKQFIAEHKTELEALKAAAEQSK